MVARGEKEFKGTGGTSGTSGRKTIRRGEAFTERMKRLGLSFLHKKSTNEELEEFRQKLLASGKAEARIQSYMSKLTAVTGGPRKHNANMAYADEFLAHFQALHPGLSGVELLLAIDSDELERFWRDFQDRAKQATGWSPGTGQVRGPGTDSMGDLITAVREFREMRGIARGAGFARGKPKAKAPALVIAAPKPKAAPAPAPGTPAPVPTPPVPKAAAVPPARGRGGRRAWPSRGRG